VRRGGAAAYALAIKRLRTGRTIGWSERQAGTCVRKRFAALYKSSRRRAPKPSLRGDPPMSFLAEVCAFLLARKKFWMLPIISAMVLLGGLVVLTKGSAVAPFIYTLF
jgi:hypothetical protein